MKGRDQLKDIRDYAWLVFLTRTVYAYVCKRSAQGNVRT